MSMTAPRFAPRRLIFVAADRNCLQLYSLRLSNVRERAFLFSAPVLRTCAASTWPRDFPTHTLGPPPHIMSDAVPPRQRSSVNSSGGGGGGGSSSKARKSKSDVIRSTVGMYLKQRNYTPTDRYRRSELQLTQTPRQIELSMMLDGDVSKVNSFLYSNAMCLNNNPLVVAQQFERFLDFVRQQPADAKAELQTFVCPLICHLFVELLKGKDPLPAHRFLRQFAHLVGPVQAEVEAGPPTSTPTPNPTNPTPLVNGINSCTAPALHNGVSAPSTSSSSAAQQPDQPPAQPPIRFLSEPENAGTIPKHFMTLVESLSLCQRPEDVDAMPLTRLFRYAQHEMSVHMATVAALKQHLLANGHVMIMHTLLSWFRLDIADAAVGERGEWLRACDVEEERDKVTKKSLAQAKRDRAEAKKRKSARAKRKSKKRKKRDRQQTRQLIRKYLTKAKKEAKAEVRKEAKKKAEAEVRTEAKADGDAVVKTEVETVDETEVKTEVEMEQVEMKIEPADEPASAADDIKVEVDEEAAAAVKIALEEEQAAAAVKIKMESDESAIAQAICDDRLVMKNLRWSMSQMQAFEAPVRVLSVCNANGLLSCADVDQMDCHLAAGFADSTVRLWPLNQSIYRGRKPYGNSWQRACPWSLQHGACELRCRDTERDDDGGDASMTSSEDEDDEVALAWRRGRDTVDKRRPRLPGRTGRRRRSRLRRTKVKKRTWTEDEWNEELQASIEKQRFDSSEYILRGHTAGVTGVLFSRQQPRLLFSVSKDRQMRAWLTRDAQSEAQYAQPAAIYRGHNYAVWCVAESSVDTYLATGSRDLTARLWSSEREFPVQTYVGHKQDVDTVAFHPNGNYLATGSADLTVRLWCITSGKLLRVFPDSRQPVQTIAFSPDGRLLAAGGEESKIRIFDLAAGTQLMELRDHSAAVTSIAWSPDGGRLVSVCADGTVRAFGVKQITNPPTAKATDAAGTSHTKVNGTKPTARHTPATPSTSSSSSTSQKCSNVVASGCKRCVRTYIAAGSGLVTCVGSVE